MEDGPKPDPVEPNHLDGVEDNPFSAVASPTGIFLPPKAFRSPICKGASGIWFSPTTLQDSVDDDKATLPGLAPVEAYRPAT